VDVVKVFGYAKDAYKRLEPPKAIEDTLSFAKLLKTKADGKRAQRQARTKQFNKAQNKRLSDRNL
jgi:hypothetical protein